MRYIDVCSGISAPTAAWKPLGWQALCYAEIEAAPRAVLAHHYPNVPLCGDFTEIKGSEYGPVDLLVGGTPCQSFSIAGLRGGLADDRGNLALEYLRLADRARPRWLVWENVSGVLSSNGGRDFGAILGGMAELGYRFAYRVLDAQHFGVPQRRRRVFVVGYLGDWRRAAAVLFERHGLSGHPAPRREKGQGVAGTLKACAGKSGTPNGAEEADRLIVAFDGQNLGTCQHLSATLDSGGAHGNRGMHVAHTIPFDTTQITSAANFSNPKPGDPCHPLARGAHAPAVAFSIMPMNSGKDCKARETDVAQPIMAGGPVGGNQGGDFVVGFQSSQSGVRECETHATLDANNGSRRHNEVIAGAAVRRLTPRECERLQGFPDDFTLVPYRKGMMADGPRYKMLGNSMAVPVMRWIGERIARVDALQFKAEAA